MVCESLKNFTRPGLESSRKNSWGVFLALFFGLSLLRGFAYAECELAPFRDRIDATLQSITVERVTDEGIS